jgi:hypothetical protein
MANAELGERHTAIAEAEGRHVRLEIEYTQTGWRVRIVETDGGTTVANELANNPYDLTAARKYAEEIANSYLANKDLKLPTIKWGR